VEKNTELKIMAYLSMGTPHMKRNGARGQTAFYTGTTLPLAYGADLQQ
jgi:hypothetical protein